MKPTPVHMFSVKDGSNETVVCATDFQTFQGELTFKRRLKTGWVNVAVFPASSWDSVTPVGIQDCH